MTKMLLGISPLLSDFWAGCQVICATVSRKSASCMLQLPDKELLEAFLLKEVRELGGWKQQSL